uniref:Serpin domain-containing protein n=1 Tax=Stomoxys calcitrans TaxID=35570 RepID=A0A1I8P1W4_STOCA
MSCRCAVISIVLTVFGIIGCIALGIFLKFRMDHQPKNSIEILHSDITKYEFTNSLEAFSGKLFKELSQAHGDKNIVYSPFSIETCLAMTRQGAENETAKEMDASFETEDKNLRSIADNYHTILEKYEKSPMLNVANKIYVQQNYKVHEEFNRTLSNEFFSSVENIDFSQNVAAASRMNKWVELKTENAIKDFVSSDNLNADTRLMLLSAIHFKGEWATGFAPEATTEEDFHTSDVNNTQKVQLMYKKDLCHYNTFYDLDASALRLPYKNSDLSMLILLPNSINGLPAMLEKLANTTFDTIMKDMETQTYVNVYLPKFKVEFEVELKDVLSKMGMGKMFSSGDFGSMLKTSEPMSVSNVMHKALIEVNEEGTKAAAASGLAITARSGAEIPSPFFRADHPFYYAIIDEDNVRMFEGIFVNA